MKRRFAWGFQWPWQFGFFSEYYDGPVWALHIGPARSGSTGQTIQGFDNS